MSHGKSDTDKPRWTLLPWHALGLVVEVLTAGAAEHGDDGWRTLPNAKERYADAAMRHFAAWMGGERIDPKSGRPHLAHFAANALLLLALDE